MQIKYITMRHDRYTFHINPNNLYKTPDHYGTAPLGWYNDHKGFLQFIHRDSVYGAAVIRKFPKPITKE